MKKEESKRKQREALKMFLAGMSKQKIANNLGVADKTIWDWSKKNKWAEKYKDSEERVTEKILTDVTEEKIRTLKIIRAIESIYAKQLTNDNMEVKTNDFTQAQKVKWDILLPRNMSQYNFLQQDKAYTINLITKSNEEIKKGRK